MRWVWLALLAMVALAMGSTASAQSGSSTTRVSVASSGQQGNGRSELPSISADGRWVAFESAADMLVPNDTNGATDIFLHDRQTGQTTRVSVATGNGQANGNSEQPALSADGRMIVFQSDASNLTSGDSNNATDIFVHDRQSGQTTRVSVSSTGAQGNGFSSNAAISADGRIVAFVSSATTLVSGGNAVFDVYLRDLQANQTSRVSVSSSGEPANDHSTTASLSADGRFVAFGSWARNLVAGDSNNAHDIFVRDRQTSQTARVSVASGGAQGDRESLAPSISADGRLVAFHSPASTLVTGDSNGVADVFVHDRQTGQTTRVSLSSGGAQGNGRSDTPSLSGDGRWVAFESEASNLVSDDTNGAQDIFLHDRQTGQSTRLSLSSGNEQANGYSYHPATSSDGRIVAFGSLASNLVIADINLVQDVFVRDRGGSSPTPTRTPAPAASATRTVTSTAPPASATPSPRPIATATPTQAAGASATRTPAASATASRTPTPTQAAGASATRTPPASATASRTPTPPAAITLQLRVGTGSDDAEEQSSDGLVVLQSSDLELVNDSGYAGEQTVGLRFEPLAIPPAARILSARIQFRADEADEAPTLLRFKAEATSNAAPFEASPYNLSARPRTSAYVEWDEVPAWQPGADRYNTPNLAPIVQQVVDRGDWQSGNALAIIVTGSGERTAFSYEGNPSQAPLLIIEYSVAPPPAPATPTGTPTRHRPLACPLARLPSRPPLHPPSRLRPPLFRLP